MATYNNPFDKAAAFWNKYCPRIKEEGKTDKFWEEVLLMAKWFDKDETEQKMFILLVEELEKVNKEVNGGKGDAAGL